ncbi:MAG: protein kinase, partial [Micromonosporaceae bacterium]|nr:protein kinase [Micromonosporaceae bacterium]
MDRTAREGSTPSRTHPSPGLDAASGWERRIGETMPAFEIIERLGRGVHSAVYQVRNNGTDYALKIIEHTAGDEDRILSAFRREAALIASVRHPRFPRVYEVGQIAGRPYLVMDFVKGRRLSEVLTAQRMKEATAVRLGIDLAETLAAVHRTGLVHRDVKPANIVIQADGQAWLVDFSLAAHLRTACDDSVVGTLLYGAPEQAGMLNRPTDGRSDLYSLGVVLFECLAGIPPFCAEDAGELIRLHASVPPPDLRSIRVDVSPPLALVIGKLLAKDPDDRYQTADGLMSDLRTIEAGPSVSEFVPGVHDQPTRTPGAVPFTGRQPQLRRLQHHWSGACQGRGALVFIQGPAGVGKSRLVCELASEVRASDHPVLSGKSSPDDPAPFAPMHAAVGGYLASLHRLPEPERAAALDLLRATLAGPGEAIRTCLPPLAAMVPPAKADVPPSRAPEQAAAVLAQWLLTFAGSQGGALLHLDDGQWTDQATRSMLKRLAESLPTCPLLVVVTVRDDPEPLAALKAAVPEQVDDEIILEPLTTAETTELVAAYLPNAEPAAPRLTARCRGNPFVLIEYLRLVIDAGLLRPSWGTWELDLDGLNRLNPPDNAIDLIIRRLERLDGPSMTVLTAAAVLGSRFDAAFLAEVCQVAPDRVPEILAEAVDHRLIEQGEPGGFAF